MRRYGSFLLRLILMSLLFWYLYKTLNWQDFAALVARSCGWWWLAAVGVYGIVTLLSILRWHILLVARHAKMRLERTAQLTMIGLFANTFLPGVMSGDVVKIFYATREIPHIKPTVVMSVVMERILGLVAMFLISTVLILVRYRALTSEPVTRYAVYFYFFVFGLILCAIALGLWKGQRVLRHFKKKLPWQENLREAVQAYRFFLRHPLCFWGGLSLSAMAHFFLMFAFYFVSLALDMHLKFWDLAAVLPLVGLVTLIPSTPNSLGVREIAFKHFLAFASMTQEASVALSLGGFFVILFWNLLGGLVYLQFHAQPAPAKIVIPESEANRESRGIDTGFPLSRE
ncbi:MAG: lysylphosphatidylglycerol synthase transmembrane domain-containing protein [bacterium]